jgi:hypothetical protein
VVRRLARQLEKELGQAKQPASRAQIKCTSQQIISELSYFHSIIFIYEILFPCELAVSGISKKVQNKLMQG